MKIIQPGSGRIWVFLAILLAAALLIALGSIIWNAPST